MDKIVTLVGAQNIENWNGGSNHEPEATVHRVAKAHWHPKGVVEEFDDGTAILNYDFALLELRDPITFWIGAKALYLPLVSEVPGPKLAISGWGYAQTEADFCRPYSPPKPAGPCLLRAASVNYMPGSTCAIQYRYGPDKICAGDILPPPSGKAICQGDSGG